MIAEKLAVTQEKTACLEEMNQHLESQKSELDDLVMELKKKIEDLETDLERALKQDELLKKEAEVACVQFRVVDESLQNSESKVSGLVGVAIACCVRLSA
jgi:predicted RNase H-like nuclease (RuvC/YqgF family)